MRILSNSAKFLLVGPYSQHIIFPPQWPLHSTYRLGMWPPYVLAIENMPPHFSTHVYYGQTVGWIRIPVIPLGTEVGHGTGNIVLWGLSSPSTQRDTAVPHFWAHCSGPHPRRPVMSIRQCAAGGCRGNPTDNCHPYS